MELRAEQAGRMQGAHQLGSLPPERSRLGPGGQQCGVGASLCRGHGQGPNTQEGVLMHRLPWPDESPRVSTAGEGCQFPKAGLGSIKILEHCWHPALGICRAFLKATDL